MHPYQLVAILWVYLAGAVLELCLVYVGDVYLSHCVSLVCCGYC